MMVHRQLIRHIESVWYKNVIESQESHQGGGLARCSKRSRVANVACVLDALNERKRAERSNIMSILTDSQTSINT